MDFTMLAVSALGGLAYAVGGYWKVHKAESVDIKHMLPVVVYGIVIGAAALFLAPTLVETEAAAFTAGLSGSVLLEKIIGGLK